MLLFKKRYIGRSFNNYRITDILGQGRFGACFLANSPTDMPVVLKRCHNRMKKEKSGKNHYEPVILSMLDHPSIPSLLGVINANRDYFYILEYMPGKSIETMLFSDHYQFSSKELYDIGLQLIELISYLHSQNIVHRDIRTANVLYDHGTIYLIDFGLARFFDQSRYLFSADFSYLGEFLLYLLYSSFQCSFSQKKAWYEELPLGDNKKQFLKRLIGIDSPYTTIEEIRKDFTLIFE